MRTSKKCDVCVLKNNPCKGRKRVSKTPCKSLKK